MIQFTCSNCGHNAFTRDEHAGKKVRCSRCQAVTVVPGQPPSATGSPLVTFLEERLIKPPPTEDKIRFYCTSCKKRIGVLRGSEGKKVKCPGCGEINAVPDDGGADYSCLLEEVFFDRIWNLGKALEHERTRSQEDHVSQEKEPTQICPCCGREIPAKSWMCNQCGKMIGKIRPDAASRRYGESHVS